jgi:PhzF family phenazine biosynthesis protein
MKLKIYQIDTFTDKIFSGNPAAVCPLGEWLSTELMQKIAMENNLAETAFYVGKENKYEIRWFTPTVEVDLCGHATLAAAYALFNHEGYGGDSIHFYSPRSGDLRVSRAGDILTLNFPADTLVPVELTKEMTDGFDILPKEAFRGKTDFMLLFENEDEIKHIKPNYDAISKLDCRGVIVTAKGNEVDFVSRFFGPQTGINEDPVTGSAHTSLIPYWFKQLGKTEMSAIQLSDRKGYLNCKHLGERVEISGKAKLYLEGTVSLA